MFLLANKPIHELVFFCMVENALLSPLKLFMCLSLEPVKYSPLHGKTDFSDVIKIFEMGLSRWSKCNHKEGIRERQ